MSQPAIIDLFISHSRQDEELADALVKLVHASLRLSAKQIRCTSLDGYRLEGGANTEERLRTELRDAAVVIGILSPASMKSTFVLFELGARWGNGRDFLPLLAGGVDAADLTPPLSNRNALSLRHDAQLHQLVRDLGNALGATPEGPEVYYRYMQEVTRLAASIPPNEPRSNAAADSNEDHVVQIQITLPLIAVAAGKLELEKEQSFSACLRALAISEATSVRVRYDWEVHIVNATHRQRGFFGHVSFRDANDYEVARNDISILRPYRVSAMAEQTYLSFLYLAPEHARLIRTVELSLLPIDIKGYEEPAAVTLEWRGVWPQ